MLTSDQIRVARALLRWSARELAEKSGVHITTVQRMERGDGPVGGMVQTLAKVQRALEGAGPGRGSGQRQRPSRPPGRRADPRKARRGRDTWWALFDATSDPDPKVREAAATVIGPMAMRTHGKQAKTPRRFRCLHPSMRFSNVNHKS